jgi:hypothetical protein
MSICTTANKSESVQQFLALMEEPDVQSVLKLFIDSAIAESELKILKRLTDIEKALGLNGFSDFTEDNEQTIQEQLSLLAERIDNIAPVTIAAPNVEHVEAHAVKTTLECKAAELVDHLKNNVTPRNGEVFLNSREIIHFLKHEIPVEYRMKDIQNPRQAKRDVLHKAVKLFPGCITLSKKRNGTKEVRIVYRAYGSIHTPET